MKTASYHVRATTAQAERWNRAAEAEGYRSAGTWLAAAADAYLRLRAKAGLPLPLAWRLGRFRVRLEDGAEHNVPGWLAAPFGIFRGTAAGPGYHGCHIYTLAYLPDARPVATFRRAGHCRALASELAGPLIRGMPPPDPGGIVERHSREAV